MHKQFNKPEVNLQNLKDNLTTLLISSLWTISKQTTFHIQSYFWHLDNFQTRHGIILRRFLCSMSGYKTERCNNFTKMYMIQHLVSRTIRTNSLYSNRGFIIEKALIFRYLFKLTIYQGRECL